MRILVTGGTGFVGSRIAGALASRSDVDVRVLTRQKNPGGQVKYAVGDLREPATVARALDGVDGVVHAASAVQGSPEEVTSLNAAGTRDLVAAAQRAGISRLVYVSTTAVYGSGPHRGSAEAGISPAPESPASISRLAAERAVLSAGGVVVRSALTYGVGDRWFVPSLIRGVSALGGLPGAGRARLSVIDVNLLGEAVASVLLRVESLRGRELHAAHPAPVPVAVLIEQLAAATGMRLPAGAVERNTAIAVGEKLGFTSHQLSLVLDDHWYDSSALWNATGVTDPARFGFTPDQGAWYRELARELLSARR